MSEKIDYLQENHFSTWYATHKTVDEELSDKQSMWCMCGRLATGLHERSCRRFKNAVNSETVKRLAHLLKNKKETYDQPSTQS